MPGPGGQPRGGGGRRGEQAEHDKRADDLGGLGDGGADNAKKSVPTSRVGTPAACATAGSMVANSSGRAIAIIAAPTPTATAIARVLAWSLIPKMLPNKTLTLAVPLLPLPWVM